MKARSLELVWIVVKDLKKAVKFYTEVVGFELMALDEEYGWAELEGELGGARLGIAQKKPSDGNEPGQNAVVTMTVDDLDASLKEFSKKGVKLLGEIQEVPGHVRMQMLQDLDGNRFQLVQVFYDEDEEEGEDDGHEHDHKGCCSGH